MANKTKLLTKDPASKLAHHRLSVLELAEALGNVSEACRRTRMDRTSFYAWRERFQRHGIEGLRDLPPIPKSNPLTTPPEVAERVVEAALVHPRWGCTKLSDHLRLQGVSISSPTVQNVLIKHGLGSVYERALEVERRHLEEGLELSAEQVHQVEKANPQFRERHVESSRPGELLCQDNYLIGTIKGLGRVYLHAVVDTYSSFAFGFLHTSRQPEAAVAVLHNEALPFYRGHGLDVGAVLTDNGREYCGTAAHPFELYLELCGLEHRRTQVRRPQSNGFVERFFLTFQREFVEEAFLRTLYTSVEQLQQDVDAWMRSYNYERPHRGYRNMGRRPFDTVQPFTQPARQDP